MSIGDEINHNSNYKLFSTDESGCDAYAIMCRHIRGDDLYECRRCSGGTPVIGMPDYERSCPWCNANVVNGRSRTIKGRMGQYRIEYICGTLVYVCLTGPGSLSVTAYQRSSACKLIEIPSGDDTI